MEVKVCTKCCKVKDVSDFHKHKGMSDGLQKHCKACRHIYYERDSDKIKQKSKDRYYSDRGSKLNYQKEYYERNKESISSYLKEYRKVYEPANRGKLNAKTAKYHAIKVSATPGWADLSAIEVEYALAAWCTEVMGTPYHVDHVVPLQGKDVCGLHVQDNLQVIPAEENISKGNRYALI